MHKPVRRTPTLSRPVAALLAVIASLVWAHAAGSAEPSRAGLRAWTLDNYQDWVRDHYGTGGGFEADLFGFPETRGFCPGLLDKTWSFAGAYSRQCSEDIVFSRYDSGKAALAALKNCVQGSLNDPKAVLLSGEACKDSPVKPSDLAGVTADDIDELRKEIQDIKDKVKKEGLARTAADTIDVFSLWKELAKCSIKAYTTAGELTEGEKNEWRDLVDVVDAVIPDIGQFVTFAGDMAELGVQGLLTKNAPKDRKEVQEFLEQTSNLKKALAERWDTLEKARQATGGKESDLVGEVQAVLDDIDSCRFDKAVDEAEILENKLNARIGELRYRVAFAEKALICQASTLKVFEANPLTGDLARRTAFLDGYTPVRGVQGGRLSVGEHRDWSGKVKAQNKLVGEYYKLRVRTREDVIARRREAFDTFITSRRASLLPLLKDMNTQMEYCQEPDQSGVSLSFEALKAALEAEKRLIDDHRCQEVASEALRGLPDNAIELLELSITARDNAKRLLAEANGDISRSLGQCRVVEAFDHWSLSAAKLRRDAQLGRPDPEACYYDKLDDLKTAIEDRAHALSDLAREADRAIAQARMARNICQADDIDGHIAKARAAIGKAECPSANGVRYRLDHLSWIETEENEECNPTKNLPNTAYVVVTVSGAGFVPHWAGGSWEVSGADDIVLTMQRDESLGERIAALREKLIGKPCKADSPSIHGAHRPWFWSGAPGIGIKLMPVKDRSKVDYEDLQDTWKVLNGDGPPLGELKKNAGCGS